MEKFKLVVYTYLKCKHAGVDLKKTFLLPFAPLNESLRIADGHFVFEITDITYNYDCNCRCPTFTGMMAGKKFDTFDELVEEASFLCDLTGGWRITLSRFESESVRRLFDEVMRKLRIEYMVDNEPRCLPTG